MALNEKLCDLVAGRIDRLMVFMPPQHGKSELCSKYFPAWYLGVYPDQEVILASYEAKFASSWGGKARNILEHDGMNIFGTNVARDSSASAEWSLVDKNGKKTGGGMHTAGGGGPITGKGAGLIIIDDPVKNSEEAFSSLKRDKLWDWYHSTVDTRIRKDTRMLLIMTRWHQDDLAGRLLKNEGYKWNVVSFPAIADSADDELGREIGEPLCEQLHPIEELRDTKRRKPSFWWSAMYQQRPVSAEGGIVKKRWLKYWRDQPEVFHEVIQSWDCSFKETGASYVVGQVWGRVDAKYYLLDQWRERADFPTTMSAIIMISHKWPTSTTKLIEDKANGPAIISTLKNDIPGIIPVNVQGSKEARLHSVSSLFEAGNVYLPDPSLNEWVKDYVDEILMFPSSTNDDQVDATSQALNRFMSVHSYDDLDFGVEAGYRKSAFREW